MWVPNMVRDVVAWDAGTDSGLRFMSRDEPSNPRMNIHEIMCTCVSHAFCMTGMTINPLGTLTIGMPYTHTQCHTHRI